MSVEPKPKFSKTPEEIRAMIDQFDPDKQVERLRQSEPKEMRRLRFLLAVAFTGGIPRLYCDDGEYSDSLTGIDFRRDSVDEIEKKMRAYHGKMSASDADIPHFL